MIQQFEGREPSKSFAPGNSPRRRPRRKLILRTAPPPAPHYQRTRPNPRRQNCLDWEIPRLPQSS